MKLPSEIWRPIPGFPGYEVSHFGRIRSSKYGVFQILKQSIKKDSRGSKTQYLRVSMTNDAGVRKNVRVHRAVLLAFMGQPPSSKHIGAHIDGNSMNNWLLNLKWATQLENEKDKELHGTKLIGVNIANSKLTPAVVRRIRKLRAKGLNPTEITKLLSALGVGRSTVNDVLKGRTWSHIV